VATLNELERSVRKGHRGGSERSGSREVGLQRRLHSDTGVWPTGGLSDLWSRDSLANGKKRYRSDELEHQNGGSVRSLHAEESASPKPIKDIKSATPPHKVKGNIGNA